MTILARILLLSIAIAPTAATAAVMVSEIAWMGTDASANDEWIELYNDGSSAVDLSGFSLSAADGTPSISLSGTIEAGAYALLERTDDTSMPGITALIIYTGALGNEGESLTLSDSGAVIQSLNFAGGWPAGDVASKHTMQWSGSSWITAEATPGNANATVGTDSDDDDDESEEEEEEQEEEDDDGEVAGVKAKAPPYKEKLVRIKALDASVPAGAPVSFSLETRNLNGSKIRKGDFFWNMGDGTERYYRTSDKFEHVYDHPGTYTAVVRYYPTYFEGTDPEIIDKFTVTIGLPEKVAITKIHLDGGVEIQNDSSEMIDLSGWFLKDGLGKTFTIPEGTFVSGGKSLTLNAKRTRMQPSSVMLFSPNGAFVSYKEKFPAPSSSATRQVSSVQSVSVAEAASSGENDAINLNERLAAEASSAQNKKRLSTWIVVFVGMIVGVSIMTFLVYRKEEDVTTDDFELLE